MGFSVEIVGSEEITRGPCRGMVHKALDRIMDRMEGGDDGGIAHLTIPCSNEEEHTHIMRVMILETSDEKECVWCNGTGVEGS